MKEKHRTKRIQRYRKMLGIIVLILTITLIGVVVSATVLYKRKNSCKTPDTILVEYMMHIPKQEYEEMYAMIDLESSGYISKEDFLKRNSTIYEGIEMQNMSIKNVEYVEEDKKVTYLTSFDTVAGTISFENEAFFINGEEGYKLVWDALIYSDNIYFAKAALKIGSDELENSLIRLGFNEELPFEIKMAESQYSNTEGIETEIQLADSGYGQGQILVNPLHMACIYSAFCNEGNVIKPYLVYQNEAEAEYWIPGAFSNETASRVLEGTKKVVNDSNGTGYAAHRDDILLAGKTGTAEIKASKDDTSGTELGWFAIFTAEDTECPILIISMVEDVKGRGGSGYVVKKDSLVLEEWFSSH